MKAPMYYTTRGIPLPEEQVANEMGVSPETLREQAECMVRDHMMCKDSEGNFHHSPVSESLVQAFRNEMRH